MLNLLSLLFSLRSCQLLLESNLRFLHLLQRIRQHLQIHVSDHVFFLARALGAAFARHPSLRRDVPVRSAIVYAPFRSLH
jgi:hypothetical protein